MNYLHWADWLVIAVYLCGIILFGVWCGKGQRNTRDYFLGSRNIPWWGVGLSIVATETSALTFIGVPAMAFGPDDLRFIQILFGYVIARILLALFLVPHFFRGDYYSPYELIHQAFGQGARRTAGGIFLVAGSLAAGVRVYVTCIPLVLILGFSEAQMIWPILLFVGMSLIYTYIGGVKAVIWTDAVQFFFFLGGGLFALFYIPGLIEGGFGTALEAAREGGKLDWLDTSFTLAKPFNIWMGVIGATFLVLFTHGADQLVVQRILACRSARDGRKAMVLSAVVIFPLMLIFLWVGVLLWVYAQYHPGLLAGVPEVRPGVSQNDYVFPAFILAELPVMLKGFLVVAILCAAMSSVSSALAALGSVSVMDFVRGMLPGRSEAFYLRLSRNSTVFWGGVLVIVALWTREAISVLQAAFSLVGLTSGAMLGALMLALWRGRGGSAGVVLGMLVSFLTMTLLFVYAREAVAWPWFTLIGVTITVGVATLYRALFERRGADESTI
jgi:solute:Na+ symporter, SSS family